LHDMDSFILMAIGRGVNEILKDENERDLDED
jgi:hypothetical protein